MRCKRLVREGQHQSLIHQLAHRGFVFAVTGSEARNLQHIRGSQSEARNPSLPNHHRFTTSPSAGHVSLARLPRISRRGGPRSQLCPVIEVVHSAVGVHPDLDVPRQGTAPRRRDHASTTTVFAVSSPDSPVEQDRARSWQLLLLRHHRESRRRDKGGCRRCHHCRVGLVGRVLLPRPGRGRTIHARPRRRPLRDPPVVVDVVGSTLCSVPHFPPLGQASSTPRRVRNACVCAAAAACHAFGQPISSRGSISVAGSTVTSARPGGGPSGFVRSWVEVEFHPRRGVLLLELRPRGGEVDRRIKKEGVGEKLVVLLLLMAVVVVKVVVTVVIIGVVFLGDGYRQAGAHLVDNKSM